MKKADGENRSALWIILVNVILICCIIGVFLLNTASYREKFQKQNIDDITNINQSSANISSAFFRSQQRSIADHAKYITQQGFDPAAAISYIADSNSDSGSCYELIGSDSKGYISVSEGGQFRTVDYSSSDYRELQSIFTAAAANDIDAIQCTQEFTDQYTAVRSFALYDRLKLAGNDKPYTLMAVFKSNDFSGLIELNGGYQDISTVLMNSNGDYVLGSASFKSDNLFKYFYDFSSLSLDEKNQAAADFADGTRTVFFYKNSQGKDCVYVTAPVPDTQWYCVTCVPLSSFHGTAMDLQFTLWMAVFLISLMVFNILWMNRSNQRLRLSIAKETEAGAAKTEFLSRMSHDIRTPLNGIIGMTYLAREQKNPEKTADYLKKIDTSSKFLLSLINDILDLTKAESNKIELHMEPYPPKEFTDYMDSVFRPLCEEKKQKFVMTIDLPEHLCPVMDKLRINQVIFNLLSNAVKYTPAGGTVSFAAQFSQPDAAGRMAAQFRVSDTGIGMTDQFQQHLFEPFTQERRADALRASGSGLGLSIAKKLVDLMGGTISVTSKIGSGTVFLLKMTVDSVALPADTEQKADVSAADSPAVLAGKHILLCEDQPLNREIMESILSEKGIQVTAAENGQKGLELFAASPADSFALILMDIRMPVMDGLTAARQIRQLARPDAKTVPIIAMTANAFEDDVNECMAAGMNAHIAKPVEPDTMFQTMAQAIQQAHSTSLAEQ